MASLNHNEITMEEQTSESNGPKTVVDSAYGSLESSSNSQSQKSYSAIGGKSQNSGSSHGSTGYGNPNYTGVRIKDSKHKDHKRKKSTNKPTDNTAQVSDESHSRKEENKEAESDQQSQSPDAETSDQSAKAEFPFKKGSQQPTVSDHPSLVYSQALNYIRKIKENSTEQGIIIGNSYLDEESIETKDLSSILQKSVSPKGFTVAISVQDGSVLQASPSITDVLGFPKELLIGHSLIELVHPKDTISFSSRIIHGLNMIPKSDGVIENSGSTFYCRLRQYNSLRNGFGIRNKRRTYTPCKMIFKHHKCKPSDSQADPNMKWFIVAEVITIESAYENPEETVGTGNFVIRHSSTCSFSEYDNEAIRFLGHLPQDLTGNSIFDCYHPEDLPKLKGIYQEIVKNQGQPYRSEPYRFRTFNNSWVTLMTEWLCFVNPWTKRIESIIGRHRILKGPKEINIFNDPCDRNQPFSDEILTTASKVKAEILELLQKPVSTYKNPCKEPTVKRRRNIAALMSPLVAELANIGKCNSACGAGGPASENMSSNKSSPTNRELPLDSFRKLTKDQVSVALGEISPHQDLRWSDQLGLFQAPLSSYHHLNYTETLERFFRSNPKTVSSDESGDNRAGTSRQDCLGLSNSDSANNKSASGSCSAAGSGDSRHILYGKHRISKTTQQPNEQIEPYASSKAGPKNPKPLTEAILGKHDEEMQRIFVSKRKGKRRPVNKKKYPHKSRLCHNIYDRQLTGNKRSGVEGEDAQRSSKYLRVELDSSFCKRGSSSSYRDKRSHTIPTIRDLSRERPNSHCDYQSGLFPPARDYYRQPPVAASRSGTASQPTFIQSQSTVPIHYYTPASSLIFQPIVPPLLNAPSVMLPNVAYRLTTLAHSSDQRDSDQTTHKVYYNDNKSNHIGSESQRLKLGIRPRPLDSASQPASLKAELGSIHREIGSPHSKIMRNTAESTRSFIEDLSSMQNEEFLKQVSQFSQSTSVRGEAESVGSPGKKHDLCPHEDAYSSSDVLMSVKSSYLSEESKMTDDSFPLTYGDSSAINEKTSNSNSSFASSPKPPRPVLSNPHWLENVQMTPELVFQYQLPTKALEEVLQKDLEALKKMKQPVAIEEQLSMLYREMALDGDSSPLNLEELSSSSNDETNYPDHSQYYSKIAMLHEENAHLPPAWMRFSTPE